MDPGVIGVSPATVEAVLARLGFAPGQLPGMDPEMSEEIVDRLVAALR